MLAILRSSAIQFLEFMHLSHSLLSLEEISSYKTVLNDLLNLEYLFIDLNNIFLILIELNFNANAHRKVKLTLPLILSRNSSRVFLNSVSHLKYTY